MGSTYSGLRSSRSCVTSGMNMASSIRTSSAKSSNVLRMPTQNASRSWPWTRSSLHRSAPSVSTTNVEQRLEVSERGQRFMTMLRPMDPGPLHLKLAYFAQRRLRPSFPDAPRDDEDLTLRALEASFLEDERGAVAGAAAQAPQDPQAFVAWFEGLRERGPGQGDRLFPWLAEQATLPQMRWFLAQEVAGEAG